MSRRFSFATKQEPQQKPPLTAQQIQQGINRLCNFIKRDKPGLRDLQRFLEQNQITDVNRASSKGRLPLQLAILAENEETVAFLVDRGADVNKRTIDGTHMLFVAMKHPSAVTRRRMCKLLLSKGADAEARDTARRLLEEAFPFISNDRSLSYWLNRARRVRIYSPVLPDMFTKIRAPRLGELYFGIVGQEIAVDSILEAMVSKRADPTLTSKPVVLFLVGPPGHGKTQLAETIMNVVAPGDSCRINCGDIVDPKWQLFGSEAGYVGTNEGTGLSNYMEAHNGRVGVCVFEEFEKNGHRGPKGAAAPV